MPAPRPLNPASSMLAYWGAELRRLRVAAGMTQRELGRRTSYSASYIGHVETARRPPSREFAIVCDKVFGTDTLTPLWDLIEEDAHPTWFRPYMELERQARTIRFWAPLLIPGLVQTPDYARALIRTSNPRWTADQVEEAVASRMRRKDVLFREDPPELLVILDEATLLRPIGGPHVMRAQLEYLLDLVETRERTSIQLVPLTMHMHAGLTGPIVVTSFRGQPDVVYLESAWRGEVITDPDGVEELTSRFDAIRVLAVPQPTSLAMIRKACEQWT